jgi:hypothetical protein
MGKNEVDLRERIPKVVKAVKYKCGCVAGSDRPTPLFAFPPTCLTHHQPIEVFYLDGGKEIVR